MSGPVDLLFDALRAADCAPKKSGKGWEARCPAHDDKRASLSLNEGDDGRALLCCHAGCETRAVVEALGLKLRDLMTDDGRGAGRPSTGATAAVGVRRQPAAPAPDWVLEAVPADAPMPSCEHPRLGRPVATWVYRTTAGEPLGVVARYPLPGDKDIRPWTHGRLYGGAPGWRLRTWPEPKPLYGLDRLAARLEAPVLVSEGEKAADGGERLMPEVVAVTSPHGADSAGTADWSPLAGRRVVVWPDADDSGRRYATDVARLALAAGAASVAVVELPEGLPTGWDLADPLPKGWTVETVRELVAAARSPEMPAVGPRVEAAADPLEKLRALTADATLDEVEAALRYLTTTMRGSATGSDSVSRGMIRERALTAVKAVKAVSSPAKLVDAALVPDLMDGAQPVAADVPAGILRDVEPWPAPVEGAEVLERVASTLRRFMVLPEGGATAVALWAALAHVHDAFPISPLLSIESPSKRCGKSLLLELIGELVPRRLPTANTSTAALFRAVELYRPTLLVDEGDSFLQDNEELRGVLNSGHRRSSATVLRCEGEELTPRAFSTWCPKAIALIGKLPGTLEDRSIVVAMRRKTRGEVVERYRSEVHSDELRDIARRLARWGADHGEKLHRADPGVPATLHDRAADNWRPLLAIADLAGGDWPRTARETADGLSGTRDSDSLGELLLADLRALFERERVDRLTSADIVRHLIAMEESPWPELSHGKPLTVRGLARLLSPFEVRPRTVRAGDARGKGYMLSDFSEAFGRYLSPLGGAVHPCHRDNAIEEGVFGSPQSVTGCSVSRIEDAREANDDKRCHDVTDEKGGTRAGGGDGTAEELF